MASIWVMRRGYPDVRQHSHLSEGAAKQIFALMLRQWKGQIKSVGAWEVLLYAPSTDFAEHRADAGIYIEWLSPPSRLWPSDHHVRKKRV